MLLFIFEDLMKIASIHIADIVNIRRTSIASGKIAVIASVTRLDLSSTRRDMNAWTR